ncbi:hypothetical protein CASFOL_011090 [Castilleja foliolosa]|uniref:Uncharacterized protein n=1 Tax=Castilleja foliolosa TaxID=1961234 RepID=A0ABD3DYH7_9LAMI
MMSSTAMAAGGAGTTRGPVLSANKKLIAEKLAEEEADKKVKGEVKKEKLREAEQGHIKLESILDAHEKFLLGVATKGGQQGPECSEMFKPIKVERREGVIVEALKLDSLQKLCSSLEPILLTVTKVVIVSSRLLVATKPCLIRV